MNFEFKVETLEEDERAGRIEVEPRTVQRDQVRVGEYVARGWR